VARTRKERLKWKRKERRRTGQPDPAKIRLHRERFLARLKARSHQELGYVALTFRARLRYDPEHDETVVVLDDRELARVPYLLVDPEGSHHLFRREEPDFEPAAERSYLRRHVRRARRGGSACHLQRQEEATVVCECILTCPWRAWDHEAGRPGCGLPRAHDERA